MRYRQTKEDLKSHLKEQIQFLLRSTQGYDDGFISEAKRIAVVIRVLLHDTNRSISLLKLLNKKNILFYDTALNGAGSNMALIMIEMGKEPRFIAPLDNGAPPRYIKGKIPFDEWWNKNVFLDKTGNKMTRKDLILSVCNQDGGAHIDPKISKAYADLTRFNSLGWIFVVGGEEIASKPALASIRQISHEVLKSFKDEFPDFFLNI